MLGIDLNDLADPLLKPRDQNALRLITHPQDTYPEHEHVFWLLWTAKEAVFKARRELTSFDPKQITVKIEQQGSNFELSSDQFHGWTVVKDQLIYSVVATDLDQIDHRISECKTDDASKEVRSMVSQYCKDKYGIDTQVVDDGNGLPILTHKNTPVSFTHHARYLGFCLPRL